MYVQQDLLHSTMVRVSSKFTVEDILNKLQNLAHNCHLFQAHRKVLITNVVKFVTCIRFNLLRGLSILLHHLICFINTIVVLYNMSKNHTSDSDQTY